MYEFWARTVLRSTVAPVRFAGEQFMNRFVLRVAAVVLGAAALAPGTVPAQENRTAPLLLEPLDWGPNAAWRRGARRVREERMQLLGRGDLQLLNSVRPGRDGRPLQRIMGALPQTAVTGAFRIPVVVVGYRDKPVQYSASAFQCLLFSRNPLACGNPGDRPYSVTTYYEEVSQGRITLDGAVLPPAAMDSNAAFYTDGCNGFTIGGRTSCPNRPVNRMALMLVAALDSVSKRPGGDTLWGQFDNDGPDGLPNSGDDDGIVDFVGFLQPEVGGECVRLDPPPTGIWSHRFVISGWMNGVNPANRPASIGSDGMYLTRTPRQGVPGQFIRVNDYTIQSQLGGATSCDAATVMGIGTIAHETGHAFGLPDLYDTSGGSQGIGGNRNSTTGNGHYRMTVDADRNGTPETARHFYRLLGDTNGDRTVNSTDQSNVQAAQGRTGKNLNADVNGDGVVNSTDRDLVRKQLGKSLASHLPLDD